MSTPPNLPGIEKDSVIAAIIYHRTGRSRVWRAHSVFTTVPGSGRYEEYDVEYSRANETTYLNNSGSGGRVYLHPLSNRSGRNSAVWWDPALAAMTNGGKVDGPALTNRTIRNWGYQIVPAPLGLMGTEHTNPLHTATGYLTGEGKTVWCKHCRSYLPADSDTPCEHLVWDEGLSEYRYRGRGRCESSC